MILTTHDTDKRLHDEVQVHVPFKHYIDVIMGAMASQITSLTIVYSTVYSGAEIKRKYQSLYQRHWSLFGEFTGDR